MNMDHLVATIMLVGAFVLWGGVAIYRWRKDVNRGR